jgi:hypothetical protein
MLIVVMLSCRFLSVIMLSGIMLSVIMLSVIMLSVIMLSVVAPLRHALNNLDLFCKMSHKSLQDIVPSPSLLSNILQIQSFLSF